MSTLFLTNHHHTFIPYLGGTIIFQSHTMDTTDGRYYPGSQPHGPDPDPIRNGLFFFFSTGFLCHEIEQNEQKALLAFFPSGQCLLYTRTHIMRFIDAILYALPTQGARTVWGCKTPIHRIFFFYTVGRQKVCVPWMFVVRANVPPLCRSMVEKDRGWDTCVVIS